MIDLAVVFSNKNTVGLDIELKNTMMILRLIHDDKERLMCSQAPDLTALAMGSMANSILFNQIIREKVNDKRGGLCDRIHTAHANLMKFYIFYQ
jgi:hypothetical protein